MLFRYQGKVIRVVDGDTVDVSVDLGFSIYRNDRFRLFGVNTPELNSSYPPEKVAAADAKKALAELVEGKIVTLATIKDRKEKYGRYLVNITTLDGVLVNQWLIDNGYAKPYNGEKR